MKPSGKGWIKLGICGVDSGQLLVCDPCYVEGNHFSYDDCCEATADNAKKGGQLNFKAGHPGAGVVFRSGCGDGCYEVWAKIKTIEGWGDRIVEVRVLMG